MLVAVVTLLTGQAATAATVKSFTSKEGKAIISINGEIVQDDVQALKDAIRAANDASRLVSGIRLNSIGGSLSAGVQMAEIIRFAKVATVVANGATCSSACFLIFAAGSEKFASHSAQVGVHGASDSDGTETVQSGAATVSMARVAKEFGVSETIIGKMVVTPPSQMVWLSANDLRSIGTIMTGKPVQVKEQTSAPNVAELPMQLAPGAIASIGAPSTAAPQAKPPSWDDLVAAAVRASASQNNGKARFLRNCQPEFKTCYSGVLYTNKNGREVLIRKSEDMNGRMVSRDLCTFNEHSDVRVCTDWDTNAKSRAMKNAEGNWYKVADE